MKLDFLFPLQFEHVGPNYYTSKYTLHLPDYMSSLQLSTGSTHHLGEWHLRVIWPEPIPTSKSEWASQVLAIYCRLIKTLKKCI